MMIHAQIMVSVESKASVPAIQAISILIAQVNDFAINLKDPDFLEYLELWKNIRNNLLCIFIVWQNSNALMLLHAQTMVPVMQHQENATATQVMKMLIAQVSTMEYFPPFTY